MTTGIRLDIIQTVHDCIGVQYHADYTIYAFKCEICRHLFGTHLAPSLAPLRHPCGTPVAPGMSPLWNPVWHPCGTLSVTPMAPGLSPRWHPLVTFNCGCLIWCQLRVPFGHHIFWVPNGALWGVVFWTRVWHLKRCHMAPFIATVYCAACDGA